MTMTHEEYIKAVGSLWKARQELEASANAIEATFPDLAQELRDTADRVLSIRNGTVMPWKRNRRTA